MSKKVMSTASTTSLKKKNFITKGNRIIMIPEGFEPISGSEKEGSAVLIKDTKTKSLYRQIPKELAIEIINKDLAFLEKANEPDLKEKMEKCEELKKEILKAKTVFQKLGNELGLRSATFRFA